MSRAKDNAGTQVRREYFSILFLCTNITYVVGRTPPIFWRCFNLTHPHHLATPSLPPTTNENEHTGARFQWWCVQDLATPSPPPTTNKNKHSCAHFRFCILPRPYYHSQPPKMSMRLLVFGGCRFCALPRPHYHSQPPKTSTLSRIDIVFIKDRVKQSVPYSQNV